MTHTIVINYAHTGNEKQIEMADSKWLKGKSNLHPRETVYNSK